MASFLNVKKEFHELSPGLSLSTSTSTSTKSPVPPMLNKRPVEATRRQQEEEGRKRPNPSQDPNPYPNNPAACYGLPATLPVLPLQFVPAFDPYTGFPCIVPFPVGLVPHLPIQLPPTPPNDPPVRRLHSCPPPEPYSHSHQGGGSSNSNMSSSSRKDSNHNNTDQGKRQKLQTGKLSQVPSENSISSEAANEEGGVITGAYNNENIINNVQKLDVTIRNNKVLPLVSTKGNGPCGTRTVYGYLNTACKRTNGTPLCIVCNCHGISFSPAEFVRHAGGPETVHPLKHINVVMSNLSGR